MKITSKSILSPGRPRDTATTPTTLSSSLSRRLKTNGSLKGQASPMFPGKKKGCSFENNPEPSSPKVTCIGQVRVKTKKQGKKLRSRSTRRRAEAQISRSYSQTHFNNNQQQQQELLSQRNQKWVHLPMTICEALRAFGSDLNCFVPCRSSCFSSKVAGKETDAASSGGCTAAMARWLVAVQGREIELVVGGDEEEEGVRSPESRRSCGRSQRRHVFEDVDVGFVVEEEGEKQEGEKQRVSVCVPPKNALLLMRCRSDPVKMAALANRFWESPLREHEEAELCEEAVTGTEQHCEDEDGDGDEDPDGENEEKLVLEHCEDPDGENAITEEKPEDLVSEEEGKIPEEEPEDLVSEEGKIPEDLVYVEEEKIPEIENREMGVGVSAIEEDCNREEEEEDAEAIEVEETVLADSTAPSEDQSAIEERAIEEQVENSTPEVQEVEEENRASVDPSSQSVQSDPEPKPESEPDTDSEICEAEVENPEIEEENPEMEVQVSATMAEETVIETEESREDDEEEERTEPGRRSNDSVSTRLPDCLLLMMCEPKLSMEVSKETWVCTTTDFIRRLPERHPKVNNKVTTTNAPDEPAQVDPTHPPPHQIRPSRRSPRNQLHQPPRSSCSFAARPSREAGGGGSMAAYEPLALKRCKSEPMRSASNLARLAQPDAAGCFWNNRRLEPHRPGIGA